MDLSAFDIEAARERIASIAQRTPLIRSPWLSDHTGREVFLKLECLQTTGSFKVRGAANKILGLTPAQRERGIIACSSGNHGLATAWVAGLEGVPATICVPEWVDPVKLAAIRDSGARAVVEGATSDESEAISWQMAEEQDLVYVHPFDDPDVIAGQGTIGAEILEQEPGVEAVVAPLSGGGLLGGIAVALASVDRRIAAVGAYAEHCAVMAESVLRGAPVVLPEKPTLATALAGGIGDPNRWTLQIVREIVTATESVGEDQIAAAMGLLLKHHRLLVEGGGAVAVAAAIAGIPALEGKRRVAVVVSGGNIDLARFQEAVAATAPGTP